MTRARYMAVAAPLALLFSWPEDPFRSLAFLSFAFLVVIEVARGPRRFWVESLAAGYFAISCAWTFLSPVQRYAAYGAQSLSIFDAQAAGALAVGAVVLWCTRAFAREFLVGFSLLALADSVLILFVRGMPTAETYGALIADGVVISWLTGIGCLAFRLTWRVPTKVFWAAAVSLGAAASVYSGASTAVALLILAAAFGVTQGPRIRPWAALAGVLVLSYALWTQGLSGLTKATSRHDIWTLAWAMLQGRPAIGFGPGTWEVLIPHAQVAQGVWPKNLFTTAHNQYLQTLFEFGAIGLVFLIAVYARALDRLWRRGPTWALYGWCALAIVGYTYSPLHFWPMPVVAACLFWESVDDTV